VKKVLVVVHPVNTCIHVEILATVNVLMVVVLHIFSVNVFIVMKILVDLRYPELSEAIAPAPP